MTAAVLAVLVLAMLLVPFALHWNAARREASAYSLADPETQRALVASYLRSQTMRADAGNHPFVFDTSSLRVCRMAHDSRCDADLVAGAGEHEWPVDVTDYAHPLPLQRLMMEGAATHLRHPDPAVDGVAFVDDGPRAFAEASGRDACAVAPVFPRMQTSRLRISRAAVDRAGGRALMMVGNSFCDGRAHGMVVALQQRDGRWCVVPQYGMRADASARQAASHGDCP